MRRRSLLAALPATVALSGCSDLSPPDVRTSGGMGVLAPMQPIQVANGLQPDGSDRVYATAIDDESPGLVTPATDAGLADRLRNDGGDVFHLLLQLRSVPDAPMSMRLVPGDAVRIDGDTLHADVAVEPWGALDRIDDDAQRERLENADELVYTSLWYLEPAVDSLPETVDLHLDHRNR